MPTTPLFALPYPNATDKVMFGSDDLQALAEAVEAKLAVAAARPIPIPFHVGGSLAVGVKTPKFIAPAAMTLRGLRAVLASGSGVAARLVVNGAANAGTATAAIGTAVVTNDFADVALAAGDTVAVEVTNAGASGVDLSVTAWATA